MKSASYSRLNSNMLYYHERAGHGTSSFESENGNGNESDQLSSETRNSLEQLAAQLESQTQKGSRSESVHQESPKAARKEVEDFQYEKQEAGPLSNIAEGVSDIIAKELLAEHKNGSITEDDIREKMEKYIKVDREEGEGEEIGSGDDFGGDNLIDDTFKKTKAKLEKVGIDVA